jgi:hypothetical protein
MPTYGDDAGHIVSPHEDTTGVAKAIGYSDDDVRAAKETLGPDTFSKPDPQDTIWPERSEGIAAARMFHQGSTPHDVSVATYHSNQHDVALPKDPPKGKAK